MQHTGPPLCLPPDASSIAHCLPDTSPADVLGALTVDRLDEDAPMDLAWAGLVQRVQHVLGAQPRANPVALDSLVDSIETHLQTEREAWAAALRDDPPWGPLGRPAWQQHTGLEDVPLLPASLPGAESPSDMDAGSAMRHAAALLAACFQQTRASAAACADAQQRALQRYRSSLPEGRYRMSAHAAALQSAVDDVLQDSTVLAEMRDDAASQLQATCAAIFAGGVHMR